ncbi:MAG: 1,4-alpha-glucan branching enzyme [Rhodospirillales bacterium]|nr:1,4-alpha-glucan branching enzyme [Rhodospirillales bacterium]
MNNDSDHRELVDDWMQQALVSPGPGDPFAFLGRHDHNGTLVVRALLPGAHGVEIIEQNGSELLGQLSPVGPFGLFAGAVASKQPYLLRIKWPDAFQETEDPYSFGIALDDLDLYLFTQGTHNNLSERFGAIPFTMDGIEGVRFSVWAPNARRVSVVGDFNSWDGRRHPMRLRHEAGVWELFIPRLVPGARYKFEIAASDGRILPQKADPLARATEPPPATASIVAPLLSFRWTDDDWMGARAERQSVEAPISIYEVHAGSWLRPAGDAAGTFDWEGLTDRLIPYATELGFTHIELMPIMEHPFGGSWGYQPLSQFAPSARFGTPKGFAKFVDECHRSGLGVILDWVPAHFPTDPHGLVQFDGSALYEHADSREGFHRDWNTLIYNLGRREVQGFLISSALYWLHTFHVDGLRVDAVASMLYRDYSRDSGEWIPNIHGGRENLESVAFLRRLNSIVTELCPGAITIAEESTAWPGVSSPIANGGLGFAYKWNMGWMHDTLNYLGQDPVYRRWHHNKISFGLMYAFSEHFVLPLSHDEVVHGKGSLFERAPGGAWLKLANLRAYFTFMWTHPGKKLLFMGGELGQPREWNHDGEVDWDLLADRGHAGLQRLIADLNRLYCDEFALHGTDTKASGFEWIAADNTDDSVFAFERRAPSSSLLIVLNMTPIVRQEYRVGAGSAGAWRELLNSDAEIYGGTGVANPLLIETEPSSWNGRPQSLCLTLPPLGALVFKRED